MIISNLRIQYLPTAATALALGIALGFGLSQTGGAAAAESAARSAASLSRTTEARITSLRREQLAALQEAAASVEAGYRNGTVGLDRVLEARRDVLDAQLALCRSDRERAVILEKKLAMARETEDATNARVQSGVAASADALSARVVRLQAEIDLTRVQGRLPAAHR